MIVVFVHARRSALHLLVLGISLADDSQLALAADNLARVAHLLDACLDLHVSPSSLELHELLTTCAWPASHALRSSPVHSPVLMHRKRSTAPSEYRPLARRVGPG